MKVEIRQFKFNMLSTRKHNKRWRQSSGDSKAPYRRRGRPRRRLMDEIHEITGTKLAELRDMTTEKNTGEDLPSRSVEFQELTVQGDMRQQIIHSCNGDISTIDPFITLINCSLHVVCRSTYLPTCLPKYWHTRKNYYTFKLKGTSSNSTLEKPSIIIKCCVNFDLQ